MQFAETSYLGGGTASPEQVNCLSEQVVLASVTSTELELK